MLIEEEYLADDRLHRILTKRLGDKKCGFRPLARHQFFGIGGDKHDGHLEAGQQFGKVVLSA